MASALFGRMKGLLSGEGGIQAINVSRIVLSTLS
jgi:hypothetical protein